LLAERRALREGLIELLPAQGPADLRDQLSLAPSEHRPGLQAESPAQALGRSGQARRAPGVARRERQPGVPGQAQGRPRCAACRQAEVQRLGKYRPGLI